MVGYTSTWVWCLGVLALLVSPATGISCGDAVSRLIPCEAYLMGMGGLNPSVQCCNSARALNKLAATKSSRRDLCQCLKQTAPSLGFQLERAKQLPLQCKLNLKVTITPDVNCNNF
ncbi:PREDICTED: non-specific lipid-transfer protein 1-like [Nelumbo nucifera]|uniref:Bifunctional inhibitor/plant lipid transfer protein/seed storage helical domain-containing protein n=2 Tax=Nelumbo nucifera TaxID=4432 RepID=A0A822YAB0_NELNU|nr:PREDICTED: non-specific lipid-transfer protein 1-like [Nelumbo nucifera]DAD28209.1 TPA_asm: hypothetical protein HUJ06_029677 [Nelumbo nucifera]